MAVRTPRVVGLKKNFNIIVSQLNSSTSPIRKPSAVPNKKPTPAPALIFSQINLLVRNPFFISFI
jgi:hypothetical protein